MKLYDILMATCVAVAVAIVIKGFWGSTRVKPKEQPDNWQNDHSSPGGH